MQKLQNKLRLIIIKIVKTIFKKYSETNYLRQKHHVYYMSEEKIYEAAILYITSRGKHWSSLRSCSPVIFSTCSIYPLPLHCFWSASFIFKSILVKKIELIQKVPSVTKAACSLCASDGVLRWTYGHFGH